jgi:opacity protein-like surface antigen
MNIRDRIDWLASVRGRVGYAPWNQVLLYVTGGGAFTRARFDVDMNDDGLRDNRQLMARSFSETRAGWVVGGGIEWAWGAFGLFGGGGGYGGGGYGGGGFGPFGGCCWTARIEFLHYEFDERDREMNFEAPDWWWKKQVRQQIVFRENERFDVNVVRFGLNYKFGGVTAPVAARY